MINRYIYSVLRFVPNPASGEFVNIGAIVGNDESGEWELRTIENNKRARQIDSRGVLPKALSVINDIGRQIDEYMDANEELFSTDIEINEDWLTCFYEDNQNVIQLSAPTPMIADDLDMAIERVFDELIISPTAKKRTKTKRVAISSIKHAYSNRHIMFGKNVYEKATLHTPNYSGQLDFVVANGKALQLTQAWSFQVQDQYSLSDHIKSWAWTIHDLRSKGAKVESGNKNFIVPSDVEIFVGCIPPEESQDEGVFSEAKLAFKEVRATLFRPGEDFLFVDNATKLLNLSTK